MLILVENVGEGQNNGEDQGWCHEMPLWTCMVDTDLYGLYVWSVDYVNL
jgi:hypothetical protein